MCGVSLGFDNEVVGVVPVGQQVCSILIVHTDVMIREHPWEEVVNLSGDIQNVTHSATTKQKNPTLIHLLLLLTNVTVTH